MRSLETCIFIDIHAGIALQLSQLKSPSPGGSVETNGSSHAITSDVCVSCIVYVM